VPITPHMVWKIYSVPIIFGILSFLFIALSITIFIKSYQPTTPITFSSEREVASVSGVQTENEIIVVDVEGAVVKPGVYRLPKGSRVEEALEVSGGFTREADRGAASRLLNRAAKLTDGAKIYVPFIGEAAAAASNDDVATHTVNVNTATQSELETLSGVGPVTAGKIISGRPYMQLIELVEKKAMSQSLFDKLKDQLTL